MNRANALRSSVAPGALLRVVTLGSAIAIGSTLPAEAARYWSESDSGYYSQQQFEQPPPRRQQQRARSKAPSKKETQVKDTTVHPQMPLIINVSIAKQKVRIYDANGLFAEAPVSTGMAGHSTPMGVFSVIQKDRYHHSNIYSGAPMPYMQRITWSGVAMHEGVLPGYPASHGCIRMPGAFAVKMWGWTKMGARVIVTPGELQPASFAHALLPAMKVAPLPVVAAVEPVAAKADKGPPEIKPIEANLELRSSVGHGDSAKAAEEAPTRTADATRSSSNAVMTDASPAREPAKADEAKTDTVKAEAAKADESKAAAANTETPKPDSAPAASVADAAKDVAAAASAAKPDTDAAAKPAQKPVEVADAARPEDRTVTADNPAETKPDAVKADTAKPETPKAETAKPEAANPAAGKADTAKAADKPTDPLKAKDQTRVSDKSAKEAKQREEQRRGTIAVFISRKDSKLYVRQNFQPLFEVPVTIAPSDRPIGTHVFTAEVDKTDTNVLKWSVVTVPPSARAAMRDSDEPRSSRRKGKGKSVPTPVEAKPQPLPDSPDEALNRITIPPEVMTRLSEVMTTGASIVVSDQGIAQGETGEYTDFIVRYY